MRRPIVAAAGVLALVSATACVPHPVGPARTFGKFEGKAVTTAESALSAVQTVRLAAASSSRGNAVGPYLSVLISELEETVAGVQGTFDSIQPPDDRADDLRDELDELLSDALDHVTDVRLAVRRGQLRTLAEVAQPLDDDLEKLSAFVEARS